MTEEGMKMAYANLCKAGIDGLIVIGGDGTFKGAVEFNKVSNIPFIGIPGTIDNDLFGTDYTIGFDTALNTIINAVDKIKDTAASHDRLFLWKSWAETPDAWPYMPELPAVQRIY